MKKLFCSMASVLLLALGACDKDEEKVKAPTLELDKTELTFPKEGSRLQVAVTSDQVWEIKINVDDTWLTASVPGGEGSLTVEFKAEEYDKIENRTTRVTIESATITREIAVTQLASDPRVEADRDALSFSYSGGEQVLHITSNTAWELGIDPKDDWLSADVTSGTGDGEVVLRTGIYYGDADRTATVALRGGAEEKSVTVTQRFPVTQGVWILSEGSATQPTADLAWYDAVNDVIHPEFYSQQNGEKLGQVANYMGLYGSKLYVAVSGPSSAIDSSVKVIDPKNGKLLKTIPMKSSHGEGDVTRQLAFHQGKVYATSYFSGGKGEPGDNYLYYGGVVRIDTVSLEIEAAARVGDKPEGIACNGNELIVCNNHSGNGTTMSIVDIETFREVRTITVPENPVYIQAADDGQIYFSTLEIFTGNNKGPSGFHRLDPNTYETTTYPGARASRFAVTDRYIFTGEFSWSTYEDVANRIDRATGEVTTLNLDHPYFMIYSFGYNPATKEVYVGGSGDDVIFMTETGEKLKSFKVGVGFVNQFVPIFE